MTLNAIDTLYKAERPGKPRLRRSKMGWLVWSGKAQVPKSGVMRMRMTLRDYGK